MSTILNYQVSAIADDAHDTGDQNNFSSTAAFLRAQTYTPSYGQWGMGFRFQDVAVPQGATIDAAYIEGYVYNTGADSAHVDIYGNDVDDANDFSTEADIWDRTRTTATVPWDEADMAAGGADWQGSQIEIKTIIQEIVDRALWVSGNNMVILLLGRLAAEQERLYFYSRDHGVSDGPKLHIEYTVAGVDKTYGVCV